MSRHIGRRRLLKAAGAGLAGPVMAALAGETPGSAPASRPDVGSIRDLPRRRLGRTGVEVAPLSLGTAAMGHAFYQAGPFEEVVHAAIDAGVTYLDCARIYDVAEERLAPILARRRGEVFLASKTWARNRDEALASLEKSLELMGVDSVDLCHIHNAGQYTRDEVFGPAGLLAAMREVRRRGLARFIGCSGHLNPDRFVPIIETGEIDVVMLAMNFVDEHTYRFQERVLPAARRHDCGIVAMKVYGGVTGSWDGYRKRRPGRLAGDEHRQQAFDFALSIPGVATCVVGLKTLQELQLAIQAVRNARPLEGERRREVLARGAALAAEWGEHFGPANE